MKRFPLLIVAFLVCQYVFGQERDFNLMGKWIFQDYANLYIEDNELIQKDIWQNRPRLPLVMEFLSNDILTIENPIYPEEKQTALWEIDSDNSFLTIMSFPCDFVYIPFYLTFRFQFNSRRIIP